MAKPVQSYADSQNSRYQNSASNLVDLVSRLQQTINNLSPQAQRNWDANLARAIAQFRRNHPGVLFTDRAQFRLCRAIERPLSDIVIDTTMQREPDLKWILSIITNFRAYQAQPIQVYETTDGRLGGWDGQHTALALYLIVTHAFKLDYTKVMVPVNIYAIQSRGELRSNFINNNTTVGKSAGKKPLDIIDIFMQKIYGVEVDAYSDPEWVEAHQKWQYLRDAGMFLTAEKFNNIEETGAISRLNELDDASVEVVRQFAVYGEYVIASQATKTKQRPLNAKEIPIIIEFLNMCAAEHISLSDEAIRSIAQHCIDLFDANFDAKGPFWEQVHIANVNAYEKMYRGLDRYLRPDPPRNTKNVPQGINFFWHQLKNSWQPHNPGVKLPKQPTATYVPSQQDLLS
jgi:hypothetical protein